MMIGRHRWTIINPAATTLILLKLHRYSLIRITGQAKYFLIVALINALLNAFQDRSGEFYRFLLQVNIFVKNSFTSGVAISIPAKFYREKMAIHRYLEIKIVFGLVSELHYAT